METLRIILDYWFVWLSILGFLSGVTAYAHRAMKMLSTVHAELTPNGGTSIKDAIDRLQAWQEASMSLSGKAYWLSDKEGRCDFASDRLAGMMGATPKQVLGYGWVNYVHPDDVEYCRTLWDEAVRDQREFHAHYRFVPPYGDSPPVSIFAHAVPARISRDGRVIGYLGWAELAH